MIILIENGEILRKTEKLRMPPQDPHSDRMERAEPQPAGLAWHHFFHALAHFSRRLIGKSDREYLRWKGHIAVQYMRNAGRQYARLARPCAGQHQERPFGGFHRFALLCIEGGKRRGQSERIVFRAMFNLRSQIRDT